MAKKNIPYRNLDFFLHSCRTINVSLPSSTLKNGSLYAHVYLGPKGKSPLRHGDTTSLSAVVAPLTKYSIPEFNTFNLLTSEVEVN